LWHDRKKGSLPEFEEKSIVEREEEEQQKQAQTLAKNDSRIAEDPDIAQIEAALDDDQPMHDEEVAEEEEQPKPRRVKRVKKAVKVQRQGKEEIAV
jgi:hypothetical protein